MINTCGSTYPGTALNFCHRIIKLGKDLHGHLVQPSPYHCCHPLNRVPKHHVQPLTQTVVASTGKGQGFGFLVEPAATAVVCEFPTPLLEEACVSLFLWWGDAAAEKCRDGPVGGKLN